MVQVEDNKLEFGEYCFQITDGTVVGYSDMVSETDAEGVRFKVIKTNNPDAYLGVSEKDLGKDLVQSAPPKNLRAVAQKAWLEYKFAEDVEDPNLQEIKSVYEKAKKDYKESLI